MRQALEMLERTSNEISQAVFDTLLYSDIFNFPLTSREIHRYLSGRTATYDEVCRVLDADRRFVKEGDYFTLPGRSELVILRKKRELRSQELLPSALAYGRVIGRLPFIRMVALTGSLAVHNVSNDFDFDYMLLTKPGRLWTARAFVLLFGRWTRLQGHIICPNLIISENSLSWRQRDLYSARDFCQMIPIAGLDVYQKLMRANPWVGEFLPNAYAEVVDIPVDKKRLNFTQNILEYLLRGSLGDRLERWEMARKIERFSKQDGFGDETIFSADICQGNFDHHRQRTQWEFQNRANRFTNAVPEAEKVAIR